MDCTCPSFRTSSEALSSDLQTSAIVDIYDVSTSLWNSTSSGAGQLGVARSRLAAAAAGSKVVFAGGLYVSCLSHD